MTSYAVLLSQLRALAVAPRRSAFARYGITLAAFAAVVAVQYRLFGAAAPWFFYTPMVVLLTLVLGAGPGILATFLSALGAGYIVYRSDNPFLLAPAHWAASIIFVITTLGLVGLVTALRAALRESDMLRVERDRELVDVAKREAFMSGVLSSSTDCIKVLDLDGRLTFMSEGGQRVMEVSDFNAIAGCPWPDFWQDRGNIEAKAAIEAARQGEARSFIGNAETMAGTPRWWHVAVSPILGPDGRPDRILSVSRDISDVRASEEERDRFVRLAENSQDFVGMANREGRVFYINDAGRRLVGLEGVDVATTAIADYFAPDDLLRVELEALPAVEERGHWTGEVRFRHFRTGELIPVHYSVFPLTDATGQMIGYGCVTRDFRERKRAEEDMRLMNGELAHRLKNVLAVVQSVAQQTLRNAPDKEVAAQDLSARLVALGAATDVLTGTSWRSADLCSLARRALAPHGALGDRILIDGPTVTLKPEVTIAMALAMHELATNAAKYGALSNDTGKVRLDWTIDGEGVDAMFALRWQEEGGPPVAPPQRRGFGSVLIERSLRSYFSGKAATDYDLKGLVFDLQSRLKDAAVVSGT